MISLSTIQEFPARDTYFQYLGSILIAFRILVVNVASNFTNLTETWYVSEKSRGFSWSRQHLIFVLVLIFCHSVYPHIFTDLEPYHFDADSDPDFLPFFVESLLTIKKSFFLILVDEICKKNTKVFFCIFLLIFCYLIIRFLYIQFCSFQALYFHYIPDLI